MTTIEDAEARVAEAKREWLDAVKRGEVQRMKDKHRKLELAEAALDRLWATDDEDEEVGEASIAFDTTEYGYRFVAHYLTGRDKTSARVEISKDGVLVKAFRWPAYKIWNIAAHTRDIAEDLNEGLAIAGSDGLGGGVVPIPEPDLYYRGERSRPAYPAQEVEPRRDPQDD